MAAAQRQLLEWLEGAAVCNCTSSPDRQNGIVHFVSSLFIRE